MNLVLSLTPLAWTGLFCALLLANLLMRFWVSSRQIRHVASHRHSVPPLFAAHIDVATHQKAAAYTIAKERLSLIKWSWQSTLLIGWTLLGGLDWLNQCLHTLLSGIWQQLALLGAFVLLNAVLELPLAWYRIFRLETHFGFNRTTLGLWLSDGLKSTLMGGIIGLPLAALVLWLMQSAGPVWWAWAWGGWMGFNLLLLVLYPTVIAPLFNRFEPLQDPALQTRIEALLQRCGFSVQGLYVMDGSKRSAHANAYFTGLGSAKRVVFFDTLLKQLSPAELDAVLAHELGHFKHRHILKRIVMMFAASLVGFALLGHLVNQVWFYTGLGVNPNLDTPNSALALLLFISVAPLVTYFITPLMSQLSRQHEFEADAYAIAQTNGADLTRALLKLYRDNASTLTPDPLFTRFYYSHPPASERLTRMAS